MRGSTKMEEKSCCVCGSEKNLIFYTKVVIKTKGFDVPFNNCYACKLCRNRIRCFQK